MTEKKPPNKLELLDVVIALSVLDALEVKEKAARKLKPVSERRQPRRDGPPSTKGKPKCPICKKRIKGTKANHDAGEHHQQALRKGQV